MNLMMRVTGALDLLLLAQMPPKGAESPDGVHRITLDVTLLGSGKLGDFSRSRRVFDGASIPSLGAYSLGSPRVKVHGVEVTMSSSDFCQDLNFFNCIKVFNEDEKILRNHSK